MATATVKIGQVWMDCDKRMHNRKLQVRRVEGGFAFCQHWAQIGGASGRETRIRLDRFKKSSTGFILVHDSPP